MRQKYIAASMKMRNRTNKVYYRMNRFPEKRQLFIVSILSHTHAIERGTIYNREQKKSY